METGKSSYEIIVSKSLLRKKGRLKRVGLLPCRWGSLHHQISCQALLSPCHAMLLVTKHKSLKAETPSGQEVNAPVPALSASSSLIVLTGDYTVRHAVSGCGLWASATRAR